MSVLIFANGVIDEVAWIRPYLETATAVIAANGGSRHLFRLNHPPNHLIGDLDSINSNIRAWLDTANCKIHAHPAEKNETDLELALLFAIEAFSKEILLFGTLGGRLDQTLANILLLTHPKLKNHTIHLITQTEKAWLVYDETNIHGAIGDTVSLIPLKDDVYFESTDGLQYPLVNERLAFGPARGISNVLTQAIATVKITSGLLLCVHTTHQ